MSRITLVGLVLGISSILQPAAGGDIRSPFASQEQFQQLTPRSQEQYAQLLPFKDHLEWEARAQHARRSAFHQLNLLYAVWVSGDGDDQRRLAEADELRRDLEGERLREVQAQSGPFFRGDSRAEPLLREEKTLLQQASWLHHFCHRYRHGHYDDLDQPLNLAGIIALNDADRELYLRSITCCRQLDQSAEEFAWNKEHDKGLVQLMVDVIAAQAVAYEEIAKIDGLLAVQRQRISELEIYHRPGYSYDPLIELHLIVGGTPREVKMARRGLVLLEQVKTYLDSTALVKSTGDRGAERK